MRPKGSAPELERRRGRAMVLLDQGMRPAAVALALGTSRASVTRWRQAVLRERAEERTIVEFRDCHVAAVHFGIHERADGTRSPPDRSRS